MNSTSEDAPPLSTLLYWEYLFLSSALAISFVSHTHLLYRCLTSVRDRLNANLYINMGLWAYTAATGSWYSGYMVFSKVRDGFQIYLPGQLFAAGSNAVSISVMFLLFDRLIIFLWPAFYRQNRGRLVGVSFIACLLTALYVCRSIPGSFQVDWSKAKGCNSFNCVLVPMATAPKVLFSVNIRMWAGIINMLLSCFFEVILVKYVIKSAQNKGNFRKANLITLTGAFSEFVCNFLPSIVSLVTGWLQIQIWEVVGPYQSVMVAVDGLLTAFIYRFIVTVAARRNANAVSSIQQKTVIVIPRSSVRTNAISF